MSVISNYYKNNPSKIEKPLYLATLFKLSNNIRRSEYNNISSQNCVCRKAPGKFPILLELFANLSRLFRRFALIDIRFLRDFRR